MRTMGMKMKTGEMKKLLATVAVFAMVISAFVVIGAEDTEAEAITADDFYNLPGGPLNFKANTVADADDKYSIDLPVSNKYFGNHLTVEWDKNTKTYTVGGSVVKYKAPTADQISARAPEQKVTGQQTFEDVLMSCGIKDNADTGFIVLSAPTDMEIKVGDGGYSPIKTDGHLLWDLASGNEFKLKESPSGWEVTVKLNVQYSNEEPKTAATNDGTVIQDTTFAFAVDNQYINSGFGNKGTWKLEGTTLTLDGYQGEALFQANFDKITVSGEVKIAVDSNKMDWKNPDGKMPDAIYGSVIGTSGAGLDITMNAGSSLNIDIAGIYGHGILDWGVGDIDFAKSGDSKPSVSINGGNKAIYNTNGNITFDAVNATLVASEKALRCANGTVTVANCDVKATVANLAGNILGADDCRGVKVTAKPTINTGKLITDSLYVTGDCDASIAGLNMVPNSALANTNALQIGFTDASQKTPKYFADGTDGALFGYGWSAVNDDVMKLAFDGKEVNQYFWFPQGVGENITATVTENTKINATTAEDFPLIGTYSHDLTVTITDGKTLTLVQGNSAGMGLRAANLDVVSSNTSAGTPANVNFNNGNRALYGSSTLDITDIKADVSASEKAIRGGNITITDSDLTVNIVPGDVNNMGVDDIFGIKGANVSIEASGAGKTSKVTTDGLRAEGTFTLTPGEGTVLLDITEYTQNPAAKLSPLVAGLYLKSTEYSVGLKGTEGMDITIYDLKQVYAPGAKIAGETAKDKNQAVESGTSGVVDSVEVAATEEVPNVSLDLSGTSTSPESTKTITTLTAPVATEEITITGVGSENTLIITNPVELKDNQSINFTGDAKSVELTINFTDAQNKTSSVKLNLTGAFTISKGSIVVGGTGVSGTLTVGPGEIVKVDSLLISNEVVGGVAGLKIVADAGSQVILRENIVVNSGATFEIASVPGVDSKNMPVMKLPAGVEIELQGDSVLKLDGIKAQVFGNIIGQTATFDISNGSKVIVDGNSTVACNLVKDADSSFDMDSAMKEYEIHGEIVSNTETNAQQIVTVTENVTILKGATLTIRGVLNVPANTMITVMNGGKLVIDGPNAVVNVLGEIVLDGGANAFDLREGKSLNVEGKFTVNDSSNAVSMNVASPVSVKGEIVIDEGAKAVFDSGVSVEAAGKLTVNGTIQGQVDHNYGTVVIDGAASATSGSDAFVISNENGGVVDIVSVAGTVKVTDQGMTLYLSKTADPASKVSDTKDNTVVFKDGKGLKIVSDVKKSAAGTYTNNMFVSGAVDAASAAVMTIEEGKVTVAADAELTLGKVKLNVAASTELSVLGKIVAVGDSSDIWGAGKITVLGSIKTKEANDIEVLQDGAAPEISAVKYVVEEGKAKFNIYTNLADALASGAKKLEVLGELKITKDTVIPAGIEIDAKAVKISDPAVLTLTDGCKFTTPERIVVEGTLIVENRDKVSIATPLSDVFVKEGVYEKYTNIYNALAQSKDGQTVKITKDDTGSGVGTVLLTKDIEIPAGVTLEVPSEKTLQVAKGVTVTVNGTLFLNYGELKAVQKNTAGKYLDPSVFGEKALDTDGDAVAATVVVSGYFKSLSPISYDTFKVAGAYYTTTFQYVVTSVDNAANVTDSDDKIFRINGTNEAGTVAFAGTAEEPVSVQIQANATLKVTKISVSNGGLAASTGAKLTGEFAGDVGSITLAKITVGVTPFSINANNTTVSKFTGAIAGDPVAKSSVVFNGKVAVSGTLEISTAAVTVAETAEVTVKNSPNVLKINVDSVVKGTLAALNGGSVNATGHNIELFGTLTVGVKDDKNVAGDLRVENLYVGASKKSFGLSGAAAVNGAPTVTEIMYVMPGSTIPADLIKEKSAIQFFVEGALWMTAYDLQKDYGETELTVNPTFSDKQFDGWVNDKGTKIGTAPEKVKFTTGQSIKATAKFTYDVYEVFVQTEPGVDSVYLDGDLMQKQTINTGTAAKPVYVSGFYKSVVAGTHKITYELANGYSGNAKLYVNGDAVSGLEFKATGAFGDSVEYNLTLQGIEKSGYVPDQPDVPVQPQPQPQPEPADDGMTVTDYLLIILVVLIAILAVMVGLKLMRS